MINVVRHSEVHIMLSITNRKPAVHNTTTITNELFINPRAQALGNEQQIKQTAIVEVFDRADYKLECSNGLCQTTWKPGKRN